MKWLRVKWNKFWDWYWHMYLHGLLGRECDACIMKEIRPKVIEFHKQMEARMTGKARYGCPQDHKNVQDFIDSL